MSFLTLKWKTDDENCRLKPVWTLKYLITLTPDPKDVLNLQYLKKTMFVSDATIFQRGNHE